MPRCHHRNDEFRRDTKRPRRRQSRSTFVASSLHPPKLFNAEGREVDLSLEPGQTVVLRDIGDKGRVRINLIGRWQWGVSEPLWVITNLEPR